MESDQGKSFSFPGCTIVFPNSIKVKGKPNMGRTFAFFQGSVYVNV